MKGKPTCGKKTQSILKRPKQPPLWLRRLNLVKADLKNVRYTRTAAEGFRQYAILSETMRCWFLDSIRQEYPGWSEEQIEQERRLILARLSAAETRWMAKWKKERDCYFRSEHRGTFATHRPVFSTRASSVCLDWRLGFGGMGQTACNQRSRFSCAGGRRRRRPPESSAHSSGDGTRCSKAPNCVFSLRALPLLYCFPATHMINRSSYGNGRSAWMDTTIGLYLQRISSCRN